jgi:UPF0755 protein
MLAALSGAVGTRPAHLLVAAPAGHGTGEAVVRTAGSDLRQIARCSRTRVGRQPRAFVLAARIAGIDRRLHPGDYRFDPGLTLSGLLRALHDGKGRTVALTVPEGWRLEQIAERLSAADVCRAEAFLRAARDSALLAELGIPGPSAEGFLFPETYALALPSDPENVIRTMHRQFAKVWGDLAALAPSATLTPLEAVTLASIVERERPLPRSVPSLRRCSSTGCASACPCRPIRPSSTGSPGSTGTSAAATCLPRAPTTPT